MYNTSKNYVISIKISCENKIEQATNQNNLYLYKNNELFI